MAQEDYRKALRLGQKEFRSSVLKGTYPYLQALDEILEHTAVEYTEPLGVVNIPLASIVGTKTAGRKTAFAGNFMPLLDEDTEFAQKWNALCDAHLSVGIRDPIKAYEYMNKFYVEEGNKRVSVMKYYEAMSIPGSVTRIVPRRSEDKENKIYYEFLDFYDLTGVNYLWFSQLGRFRAMDQAVNSRPGQPWSKEDQRDFQTAYYNFEDAFHRCGGARLPITVGDALLKFVGVYPYETIRDKTGREMAAELEKMWSEIEALTQDEAVELSLEPTTQAPPLISRILPLEQSRLNVAFLYEKSADTSAWTYAHEFGRGHVDEVLAGRVFTKGYDNIRVGENDDEVIERAIADGNDVLFTTTPKLMECSLRAAIRHPEVKILNCSLNMDHPSVRTYYGRIYEAKFLVGAIAGALADNNRVGYIANYPIYGMVAGINAFALGARMANPRAKVHLMWTGEKGVDALSELEKRGVELISSQDAGLPRGDKHYGLYRLDGEEPVPLAMPFWHWGEFYERILRGIMDGRWKLEGNEAGRAVNYWWGMASGMIDVLQSRSLPRGTKRLAAILHKGLCSGTIVPFEGELYAQGGVMIQAEDKQMEPEEILRMDWLAENVEGHIPAFDDLIEEAKPLVRLQGIYKEAQV